MQTSAERGADVIPGDRYHVVRVLKRGKHVETLLAIDATCGAAVVVKLVAEKSISRDVAFQLKHEISVLGGAKIAHAAPPQVILREKQHLYLVRPFIAGITLKLLLQQGPLKVADVLTVGNCLFSAIRDVHARKVLHGDIRPANVIVAEGWPANGVVLVGFDLPRGMPPDLLSNEESIEAAKYRSPEQAGTLDHGVAEPSDLYSVGAVLFECLAGRAPFDGENVGAILFEHMTGRAPELRSLGLEIPRALDELIQRLLRNDPDQRYQSAEAVLADLANIAAAVEAGQREPSCVVGSRDRRPTLTEPAFVGRCRELQQLDEQIRRTRAGRGTLVFVESESGGGKTRLLTELALRRPGRNGGVSRSRLRASRAAPVSSDRRRRRSIDRSHAVGAEHRRHRAPPPRRPLRRGRRRRPRTDGARLAFFRLIGTGGLRRSPQHSSLGHAVGCAGIGAAARDGRAGRLSMGRRIDGQADRTVAGESPSFVAGRSSRLFGGCVPHGRDSRGSSASQTHAGASLES